MSMEKLVEKIKELLKMNIELDVFLGFNEEKIERLIVCIRDRIDQVER